MKKTILSVLFIISSLYIKAQSYSGFLTDNYSGVNSVIVNPANIADSRFKFDINLVGISGFLGNDYYKANVFDAISDDFDFDLDGTKTPTTSNSFSTNVDILGPSFMFNLDKKSSLAIFTRARFIASGNDINGESIDNLDDELNTSEDYNIDEGNIYFSTNAWAEIGVSYARVIMNKEQHFLKGGISLKYLMGYGNAYGFGNDITINYDADGTDLGGGNTTGSLTSFGTINYGKSENISDNFDDYEFEKVGGGFAGDIGAVYEWRPNYKDYIVTNSNEESYTYRDKNKYKLKLGFSITDLGVLSYDNTTETSYDINATIDENTFDSIDGFEDRLNSLYTVLNTTGDSRAVLPTALHLNADWSFNKNLYLNLNTDLSLTSKKKANTSSYSNVVALTPRFESKWFSFYLPLNIVQSVGFQAGAGMRLGPLYLGSGSVLSVLSSETKGADFYVGLKVPGYYSKPKDKDDDGIIDKLDTCPKVSGPIENSGCPWQDTDGDAILDNEDKCINEPGPFVNNGCPWEDTDGDNLLDNVDNCPNEAGPIENDGCPWPDTDKDGVYDKDDKCIDEPGDVANDGCPEPEVTEEVQKTLNDYAKTILFNSGKSSIKAESSQILVDIINILNEYPNANFVIEGHTDSIGSEVSNQKLSESRATSVKEFLVDKGINSTRLTSKGYGESNPIAPNNTAEGRLINRRVELIIR